MRLRFIIRDLLKCKSAFSMVELAIVLAVMGVIAGLSVPALSKLRDAGKSKKSHETVQSVLKVIGAYVLRVGELPCQADSLDDGISAKKCSKHGSHGFLPYQTLGLPKRMAFDGWGKPLRYSVLYGIEERDAVDIIDNIEHFNYRMCYQKFEDSFHIFSHETEKELASAVNKNPVVIVITAFNDGFDAKGKFEEENKSDSNRFYDGTYLNDSKNPFRHQVFWLNRDYLFSVYCGVVCKNYALKPEAGPAKKSGGESNYTPNPPSSGVSDFDDDDLFLRE